MDTLTLTVIDVCMWAALTLGAVGLMATPSGALARKGFGFALFIGCIYFAAGMFKIGRW